MRIIRLLLLSAIVLTACSKPAPPASETPPPPPAAAPTPAPAETPPAAADPVASAISAAGRPAADLAADESRKPAEVLAFFEVKSGMTVLDVFAGGGYFTELLSHVVGPDGRVYAHNNPPYLDYAKDEIAKRYADPGRLANVQRVTAENNALELPENTFDFVLMSMAYHDIYMVDAEHGWPRIDGPKMLAEIHAAMKPGAVLGVVDHVASAGAPPETGGTLHRIDPELLKKDLTAAGFVFEAESDVLRNPADDHTLGVFDDAMRGKTDRFVFRFRKP